MRMIISCMECQMECDSLGYPLVQVVELMDECVLAFTGERGQENLFEGTFVRISRKVPKFIRR